MSADFETQARQAFDPLPLVLCAAGSSLTNVAKTTIWLVDAANFDCPNKLYAGYFPTRPLYPGCRLARKAFQTHIEAITTVG